MGDGHRGPLPSGSLWPQTQGSLGPWGIVHAHHSGAPQGPQGITSRTPEARPPEVRPPQARPLEAHPPQACPPQARPPQRYTTSMENTLDGKEERKISPLLREHLAELGASLCRNFLSEAEAPQCAPFH